MPLVAARVRMLISIRRTLRVPRQTDESGDLAPGRVLASDAGCWMVGQVLDSEGGFRP